MINQKNNLVLILFSIALLIGTVYLLSDLPDLINQKTAIAPRKQSIVSSTLANMDKVLTNKEKHENFTYTGTFENPFRKFNMNSIQQTASTPSHKKITERQIFLLKGVLIKEKSLAIIEDSRGETYIRGIGEKAVDQEIVSIKENKVVLRDSHGLHELVVEDPQ
jgi:hypothetical protein